MPPAAARCPDFTAAVLATDNVTPTNALLKTQSPLAGTRVGPGTTPVTITVKDAAGNAASCATAFNVSGAAPSANFTASPLTGHVPLTVDFSNISTGTISSAVWNFGDGGTSTATGNPSHTYTNAASFSVSLTVLGPLGSNTLTRSSYITVTNAPPPLITLAPAVTNAFLVINGRTVVVAGDTNLFTVGAVDQAGNPLTYQWAFGDGALTATSALSSAQHIYSTNCGPRAASVTVSDPWAATTSNLTVTVACALDLTKPAGKLTAALNFAKRSNDTCNLTAKLDLGPAFSVSNQTVIVDIGGARVPFTLDKTGRGLTKTPAPLVATCRLAYTKPTKTKPGFWTLTAAFTKGTWRDTWAAYGLVNQTIPIKPSKTPALVNLAGGGPRRRRRLCRRAVVIVHRHAQQVRHREVRNS